MRKVLFLDEQTRNELNLYVNKQLQIKNRLIMLLNENNDHKLSSKNQNYLYNKYQEQIVLLDLIKSNLILGSSRKQIQEINRLIDEFYKIERDTNILR